MVILSLLLHRCSRTAPPASSLNPERKRADPADPYKLTDETRELGLVVCRGTQVSLISPTDGMEEIENPFVAPEG